LAEIGTPGGLELIAVTGMVPLKNFHECGQWEEGKELQHVAKNYGVRRSACLGCNIHCHALYEVREGKYAGAKGGGPEYETLAALGTKCLCNNLPAILHMNALCNKYGLDTVSTGNIIALLMDLYDRGIISKQETDGIPMVWGDADAMIQMIDKIAHREGVGDKLAEDQLEYARNLKRDAEKFVVHNKGLPPTGVEIRAAMGAALSFGVSPRGAHHLSGLPTVEWVQSPVVAKKICGKAEGGDTMSYHPQAKAKIVQYYENLFIIIDSLGICKFDFGHDHTWHDSAEELADLEETLCKFLEVVTGEKFTWEELFTIADRVYNIERLYINSMGMTRKDDQPCIRSQTESCPGEHPVGPVPLPPIDMRKYNKMLDGYYELRGWDKEGRPTKETIEKLGLSEEV
jgi:aldehyde:ferredoxin oxidoreductase